MNRNTATRDRHRRAISKDKPDCAYDHCLYPGEPIDYDADHLDPKAFTVDHIIPTAKGGLDTLDNKQPMHRACNRDKSDKLDPDTAAQLKTSARTFTTTLTW